MSNTLLQEIEELHPSLIEMGEYDFLAQHKAFIRRTSCEATQDRDLIHNHFVLINCERLLKREGQFDFRFPPNEKMKESFDSSYRIVHYERILSILANWAISGTVSGEYISPNAILDVIQSNGEELGYWEE